MQLSKYLRMVFPAISFIALFQGSIDLGHSLQQIIYYYNIFRDFFFIPFEWIDIDVPSYLKNFISFLTLLSFSFTFRGNNSNRVYILFFIASVFGLLLAILLWYLSDIIAGGELGKSSENDSFWTEVRRGIGSILFFPGMVLICSFFVWQIALLAPGLIHFLGKYNIVTYDLIETTTEYFLSFLKAIGKNLPIQWMNDYFENISSFDVEFLLLEPWYKDEYIEYYRPLVDLLYTALYLGLVFKVLVDNLIDS